VTGETARIGRTRRTPGFLLVLLLVSAGVVAGAAPAGALEGNATPTLDPVNGKVAVAASSAPVRDRVAFIVVNGTDAPVRVRKVSAVAAQSEGSRVIRATTKAVVPIVLDPGEAGLGEVAFRSGSLRPDATFVWDVDTTRAPTGGDAAALEVSDFVLSLPMTGAVAQTLSFDVANAGSTAVKGPISAQVVCLNEAKRPALVASTTVRRSSVRPGVAVPVTLKLRELCPSYVVAARGRAAR
jgi:hypothetical protein